MKAYIILLTQRPSPSIGCLSHFQSASDQKPPLLSDASTYPSLIQSRRGSLGVAYLVIFF